MGEAVGNREDSGSQMLWLAGAPTPMGPRGPWRPAVFLHIASMSTEEAGVMDHHLHLSSLGLAPLISGMGSIGVS